MADYKPTDFTEEPITDIRIDKNIPIPPHEPNLRGKYLALIKALTVGDSAAVPISQKEYLKEALHHYLARTSNNRKFELRKVIEDGVKVMRIWRTN